MGRQQKIDRRRGKTDRFWFGSFGRVHMFVMAEQTTFHKFSNKNGCFFHLSAMPLYSMCRFDEPNKTWLCGLYNIEENLWSETNYKTKQPNSHACHTFENGIDGIQITKMRNPMDEMNTWNFINLADSDKIKIMPIQVRGLLHIPIISDLEWLQF